VSSIAVRPSSPQRRWRKVFGAQAAARSAAQGPGEHASAAMPGAGIGQGKVTGQGEELRKDGNPRQHPARPSANRRAASAPRPPGR